MKHGGQYNRLYFCPFCSGRLGGDKSPYVSEQGVAYRTRLCRDCGLTVYSKQGPEEITGTEMPETISSHPGPVLQQQAHELDELCGEMQPASAEIDKMAQQYVPHTNAYQQEQNSPLQ